MKETLLDSDHKPTIEELQERFKKNDFSAAAFIDMNTDTMEPDTAEDIVYIKGLINKEWESLSRQMGLKASSCYYTKDNPMIVLREGLGNAAAGGLLRWCQEKPEEIEEFFCQHIEQCIENPGLEAASDEFLHNAVETLMKVTEYDKLAAAVHKNAAHEDFKQYNKNNYRSKDFNRKWNHTRTKTQMIPLDGKQYQNWKKKQDASFDVEKELVLKEKWGRFWDSLSEEEKELLIMRMDGLTQKEIAEILGLKTHSAVSKRQNKLKQKHLKLLEQMK